MATALRHVHTTPWPEPPPASRHAAPPLRPPSSREVWLDRTRESLAPLVAVLRAGYGAALLAVAAASGAAWILRLGSEPGLFAPFLVAVVAVALRHGIGPALLAIATSMVIAYAWFLAPMMALAFDPGALRRLAFYRLGVFGCCGVLITLFAEAHRQSLQELERSRRQLRAFTANEEIGLQVVDHDGRTTWADGATARLLGYEPNEYVGESFARFHVDPALASEVQTCLATGRPIENVRASLRRKDGTVQDVLLNSNTLLGDARTAGNGVLVAVLPLKVPTPAVDGTKLAVSFLLERRRKAAAERQAQSSTTPLP